VAARAVTAALTVAVVLFMAGASDARLPTSPIGVAKAPVAFAPTPGVGPELPTADPVPTDSVPGTQINATAAFDGENYLVVWEDERSFVAADIYGARVRPDGTVVERVDVPISTAVGHQREPDVTFDGTNFLVTWTDGRNGSDTDVYGARVSRAGAVLDAAGVAIATGPGDQRSPAQVFDGTNHFVTWTDQVGEAAEIHGARVSPAAVVVDAPAIVVSGDAYPYTSPDVAFNGTDHLVVWAVAGPADDPWARDVHGARVDPEGTVLDATAIVVATGDADQELPAVASDGSAFLVVWHDQGPGEEIRGARVAADGAVVDPAGIALTATPSADETEPAVAFGAGNYLVAWEASEYEVGTGIFGTRVTPAGLVLDDGTSIYSGPDRYGARAAVASGGGGWAVLLFGDGPDSADLHMVRVDAAGAAVGTTKVPSALSAQVDPLVTAGDGQSLVLWTDNRAPDGGLYGARVSDDGTPLDGAGFLVVPGADEPSVPAVAFDGTNYLVVYRSGPFEHRQIRGTRISQAGAVLDPGGFLIHDDTTRTLGSPSLAFDGVNYLVTWDTTVVYETSVYATRLSTEGTVLDEPFVVDSGFLGASAVMAFDGSNYVVVTIRIVFTATTINAARVSPAGEVISATQIHAAPAQSRISVDVASNGANTLVVWTLSASYEETAASDVFGARVDQDGVVLDPAIPIAAGGHRETQPDVTANGNYLVVWRDERAGFGSYDVYGTRVTGSGRVVDGGGFAIAAGPTAELAPTAAPRPGGGFTVGYQRFVPEQPYATQRAFLRQVAPK
jgi:hypothetical protein